ncbi:transcriptional regulator, LacI family (plasmid) [Rhizobium freirei PRF 81]|uniref:Transcriptional regulator, LacI family n=1 Tax=Rhizobium freirei PRF 81 TaxID=363754 RepID=N6TTL8_9HYPH|nr:LacI family DNA-binding transcriptional regulator [Rhizobium freirei]ENN83839.1 transcriptional regulator, LacI family [Rhizobium freirei PRF 81]
MARQSRQKRVTILDVAKDAKVSFAAVSKVLRNAYGVSDALREKVNISIKKLGYTPNTAARAMRGRTFVVGVIFPDMRNPFFADILAGISSALERTQYESVQGIARHSTEPSLVQSMIDMQMDGLILVGTTATSKALSAVGQKKPTAVIGHHLPDTKSVDTVNNDDEISGRLVVRHLVEQGYRKIVMLSLDTENGTVIERREAGYRSEMEGAGLEGAIKVVRVSQSLREIQVAAKALISRQDRPDAIFCWTDFVALEVISVAQASGLNIPDDIAVVGHDNTIYCDFHQNSLTSVDQSGEQLGLQAARLLIERIEGRSKCEHFLVHPRLVARRSSLRAESVA